MARVNLTAEGKTEQLFVVQVLQPHLASLGVYLMKPRLSALGRKKGHTHRGGLDKYLPVKNDICRWLKQDRAADAHFTTMFDLYGLPRDFPGYAEAGKRPDARGRVVALEAALREDIDDSRFIPYIQLHEFEALLLSDPSAFACRYTEHARQIERLIQLCAKYKTPEDIDDGQHSAPSIRIGKEIPEYVHAKPTAGPIIAAGIGLEKIRQKCPHFNDWLTKLEALSAA